LAGGARGHQRIHQSRPLDIRSTCPLCGRSERSKQREYIALYDVLYVSRAVVREPPSRFPLRRNSRVIGGAPVMVAGHADTHGAKVGTRR
jgi:hypothetical protein